jgi:hypothetical protein
MQEVVMERIEKSIDVELINTVYQWTQLRNFQAS